MLAQLLGSSLATKDSLHEVLKAYEAVRLPLANHVLRGSAESGLMYEFNHPLLGEDYANLGRAIERQWDWVWQSHPTEDVHKGLDILGQSILRHSK